VTNAGGSGSNAFLVDSMTHCGVSAPTAIGCAIQPGCNNNGNDDPNLWMIVTVESFDAGTLPAVVAHERGHNSCLAHTAVAECQLMQGTIFTPGLVGCLTALECGSFQSGRTTTSSGLECGCHDDLGGLLDDGAICTEVVDGLCSGGLCGHFAGDAGVQLIVAAAPGTSMGGPPDDALRISALKGEWTTLAQFAPTSDDVRGMAYASDSQTLFGVVPTVFDDSIVTIDVATGLILATVGTITNGAAEIVSMAYDPGATNASTDDRLIVLEVDGLSGAFHSINPSSPSALVFLGTLGWTSPEVFTGMAYDSVHDKLFMATPLSPNGLYEVDLSSCPPSPCTSSQILNANLPRGDASLSFSPVTGMLYLVGTAWSSQRTFYDVIDPLTGMSAETVSLDVFTPAGLAAVPEPGVSVGLGAGVMSLALGVRRRRKTRGRRARVC